MFKYRARSDHRTEQQMLQRAQREVERRQQDLEEKRVKLEGDYSELEHTLELAVVARERAEHEKVFSSRMLKLYIFKCDLIIRY
jgi:hypothetical protein